MVNNDVMAEVPNVYGTEYTDIVPTDRQWE